MPPVPPHFAHRPNALRSQVNPRSPTFAANAQRMQALLDEVNRHLNCIGPERDRGRVMGRTR